MNSHDISSSNYQDIYLTQFFTTLGQLSAVLVSSSVAVPMWKYYNLGYSSLWLKVKEKMLTTWDYIWYNDFAEYEQKDE